MNALDELLKDVPQDYDFDAVEVANNLMRLYTPAVVELTALRERVAKLEKVEECAKKLVALRGVAHGAWVVEELEAALKSQ